MKPNLPKLMVIIMFFGLVFTIGGYFISGLGAFIVILFAWLMIFGILKAFNFRVQWMMTFVVIGVVASAMIMFLWADASPDDLRITDTTPHETTDKRNTASITNLSGEILVEAETGTLSNEGRYSYIGTSARGEEAYLGDGGAKATYSIQAKEGGTYVLWVKISDDGEHQSGQRDVTVTINNQMIHYVHITENTKGWKWVEVDSVDLIKGINNVIFTKDKTTSAAYVMDAFKFVPNS